MALLGSKTRSRINNSADHDGWLVSYADMVTLLLGFFVVLYSFSEVNERRLSSVGKEMAEALGALKMSHDKEQSEDGMSEERMLKALQMMIALLNLGQTTEDGVREIEKGASDSATDKENYDKVKQKLKSMDRAGLLSINQSADQQESTMTIALPSKFLFKPGSSDLLPEAQTKLKEVAKSLSSTAEIAPIDVIGHTDSQPLISRTYRDNWDLSAARAAEVAKQLLANGVPKGRIQIIGKADQNPLFPERDSSGRYIEENLSRNRRVEIVVHRTKRP